MSNRKIDILDILPQEAVDKIDDLGYEFLKGLGYNVDGVKQSKEKQKKLKEQLAKNGQKLLYSGVVDKDTGAILIWFEIFKGKAKVATSRGIKFMPKGVINGKKREEDR